MKVVLQLLIALLATASSAATASGWIEDAVRSFRGEASAIEVVRKHGVAQTDLEKAAAALDPHSIEAAGVAYVGAMTDDRVEPWIAKLVRAYSQRWARTEKSDVRLHLPAALVRVFKFRRSMAALRALVDLRADGSYATVLNDARLDFLLGQPASFEAPLQERPSELPWHPRFRRGEMGFTNDLAWLLASSPEDRRRVAAVKTRPDLTPFMRRYLRALISLSEQHQRELRERVSA